MGDTLTEKENIMTSTDMILNITSVYNAATAEEKNVGIVWYSYAHNQLKDMAVAYNFSFDAVVDATAAISPGIRWQSNIKGIEILCDSIANNRPLSAIVGVAGYRRNIDKACAILLADMRNEPFRHILSGPKVTAFADNMRLGDDDVKVTIDVHAYSIAMGERFTVSNIPHISPSVRNAMVNAYRHVAGIYGISPKALQAVTWVAWKRIHGV